MARKIVVFVFAACLAFLATSSPLLGEERTHFRVVASEYEPFVFMKDGKLTGLDIDILDMALKAKGYTYEIKLVQFSKLFEILEKGEADIAIGALYRTPERDKRFISTEPYLDTGLVIISPPSRPINNEREMKKKKVGVKKGATGEACLKRLNSKGYEISAFAFDSTEESFEALKIGEIDALLDDYIGSHFLIHEKYFGDALISEEFFGPHFIEENSLVFYFRPALEEKAGEFDTSLRVMDKEKILEGIRKRWLPGMMTGGGGRLMKLIIMLTGLVLFLGFLALLRRENLKRKTLILSEKKYRELLEHSPMAVMMHKEGKLLFANATAYRMFGYEKGQVPEGASIMNFIAEGERARLKDLIRRRLDGKEVPENYETYGLKSNGTAFPIDVSVAMTDYAEEKALIVVMKDISEQKKVSSELKKSEERYRHLFNEIDHGIFISSKEGKPVVSNPALVKMLGYDSFEELLTRDIEKNGYQDPAERRRFQELMEKDGKVNNFETVWLKKDGTPIDVVESSNAVRDEHGHIVGYEGIVRDRTEKKKAEVALRESERYYRNLFEGAHDAIMVFDPEGEIVLDANDQCLRLYDLRRDEFVGHSLEKFSKNVAYGKTKIKDVLRKGQLKNFNTVHLKKDGSEMILEINASVINYRGRLAILSHARDITEKKKAEEIMLEKNRQLMALFRAMEAMGSFTDLKASAYALCKAIVDSFSLKMAWIGLVVPESTQVKILASAGLDDGYTTRVNVRWDESVRARGPTGRAIVTRAPVIMDVDDPDFEPWRAEAKKRGFKLSCAIPLIHEDAVRGALHFYSDSPDGFSPERMETLEALAKPATMTVVTAGLYEEANRTIEELLQTNIEKEKIAVELERRLSDLAKSEKKFRSIVEQARAILLVFDKDGIVTYWNEYAAAFFGFHEDEILGKSLFDTIVPPTESTGRDLVALLHAIIMETNKFASNINENMKKDGTRVWIAWTNRPVLDKDGNVVEVLSVGTDITHLKHYETAIVMWEKLFREILSGGNGAIYRRDLSFNLEETSGTSGADENAAVNWKRVREEMEKEPERSEFLSSIISSQRPSYRKVTVALGNGTSWNVIDAAQCIRDNSGNLKHISGFWLKVS